jgi:hypothetical protein
MGTAPAVIVSSTCHDLKDARNHLFKFITEELGYQALLSERPSFPIDPDIDTIENCIRRVSSDVDIMVLVVGGKYGSLDPRSGKSVTNLEYLAAKSKGIPVYAFVERDVLSLLETWRAGRDGDYSAAVDTNDVFVFVDSLYNQDRVWVFPFDLATDISNVLRVQLAYLFLDALHLRQRLGGEWMPWLNHLGAASIRTALERPPYWEFRLFFQAWLDELDRRVWALRDYDSQLAIGPSEDVTGRPAIDWARTRLHELENLAAVANHLVKVSVPEAFGTPVKPSNPEHIVWLSRTFGQSLDAALEWTARIRRVRCDPVLADVFTELAAMSGEFIREFRDFPRINLARLDEAMKKVLVGENVEIHFVLTLSIGNGEGFQAAVERAKARM